MNIRSGPVYGTVDFIGELEICCRKLAKVARNRAPWRNAADLRL